MHSTNIPNTICVDVVDIEVNLADKYKFPAKDKIRPDSYTKTFNAVECLQHVIKLSACQLDNEHLLRLLEFGGQKGLPIFGII